MTSRASTTDVAHSSRIDSSPLAAPAVLPVILRPPGPGEQPPRRESRKAAPAAETVPPADPLCIKGAVPLPDDPQLHKNLLAYLSDYQLVGTAALAHEVSFVSGQLQMASLDHAIWFHRSFRIDEWLLCAMESPNASGARGLAFGRFFTQSGRLAASTAQEGLIRLWAPPK